MDYRKSWMSLLPASASIGQVSIPGTHDSGTHSVSLAFSRLIPRVGRFVQTQTLNLREQLDLGVRFLDLRFEPEDDFRLHHGSYKLDGRLSEALKTVMAFLLEHGSETVIVSLKKESDNGRAETAEKLSGLIDSLGREHFFCEQRIPTIGEVRGRIVILNRVFERNDLGPFVWFNYNTTFTKTQVQAASRRIVQLPDGSTHEEEVSPSLEFTVQDVCDPEPSGGESA